MYPGAPRALHEKLAVEHTQSPEEAALLVERLCEFHPRGRIHVSTMTPVIGAHTGPVSYCITDFSVGTIRFTTIAFRSIKAGIRGAISFFHFSLS